MPNVNDLKQSSFLAQKDVEPPILVTIRRYEKVNVAKEGAEPEMRWVLHFDECDKPMTLNVTNGRIISSIVKSDDFDDWIGTKIVLYVKEDVEFAGKITGGIRVRAPKAGYQEPEPTPPKEDDIPF